MSDEIYICTAAHHCDEAMDNGCDHSGFHERIDGECVGKCTHDDSAECVKASTYHNPEEIAAFESLVDAYVVPDAELSPSGKKLREELCKCIDTATHKKNMFTRDAHRALIKTGGRYRNERYEKEHTVIGFTGYQVVILEVGAIAGNELYANCSIFLEHWRLCDG